MAIHDRHVPVVTRRRDGRWGVWCLACSEQEQDYTYQCQCEQDDWPPEILTDP